MARIYVSIAIILSIIGLDIFSIFMIRNEQQSLDETLTLIQDNVNNNDKEAAIATAEKLSANWDDSYKRIVFFVNSKSLEDINDFVTRVKPLLESDSDEITAEIETIKRKLYRTYVKDVPYIYNIF